MSLDSVNPVNTSTNNHINQQDFLRILLTQLNAQNPLKPMDNGAFVAQLAQFSQLESAQQMVTSLNQLVSLQTATQSVALLGKSVDALGTSGQVTGLAISGATQTLTVHPVSGADVSGVARSAITNIR